MIYGVGVGLFVCWLTLTVFFAIWWPFKACRRCDGSGKRSSPSGRAWRPCRRCKGSGAKLRLTRRLWNWTRRTGRKATA